MFNDDHLENTKALLAALIDHITVDDRSRIKPVFRIPLHNETNPTLKSQDGVREICDSVVLAALSSNTTSPLKRALAAYRRIDLSKPRTAHVRPPVTKQHIRLSEPQLRDLASRYEAGATVYELATHFSIHRHTVSQHLQQLGTQLRGQSPTTEQVDQMISLYSSGLSLAKVGIILGFDGQTVHNHLRAQGIQCRDPQGRER